MPCIGDEPRRFCRILSGMAAAPYHFTRRDLLAKGVIVTEPEVKEWGTFFKFTDPDGHRFVVSSH
jgi:hypothetical protein